MRLATIAAHRFSLTLNVVASDLQLSTELHDHLIELKYLKSSCCKRFEETCDCGTAFEKFRLECRLPRGVIDDRVAVLLSRSAAIAKLRLGDRVSVQLPGGYSHSNGTFMAINHQARTVRVHWSETNLILDCNFVDLLPAHP